MDVYFYVVGYFGKIFIGFDSFSWVIFFLDWYIMGVVIFDYMMVIDDGIDMFDGKNVVVFFG